jgi:hypothetical protein
LVDGEKTDVNNFFFVFIFSCVFVVVSICIDFACTPEKPVSIPGASALSLTFDRQCRIHKNDRSTFFYITKMDGNVLFQFGNPNDGSGGRTLPFPETPLIIEGDYVKIGFQLNSSSAFGLGLSLADPTADARLERFGIKVEIAAVVSQQPLKFNWLVDLCMSLSLLCRRALQPWLQPWSSRDLYPFSSTVMPKVLSSSSAEAWEMLQSSLPSWLGTDLFATGFNIEAAVRASSSFVMPSPFLQSWIVEPTSAQRALWQHLKKAPYRPVMSHLAQQELAPAERGFIAALWHVYGLVSDAEALMSQLDPLGDETAMLTWLQLPDHHGFTAQMFQLQKKHVHPFLASLLQLKQQASPTLLPSSVADCKEDMDSKEGPVDEEARIAAENEATRVAYARYDIVNQQSAKLQCLRDVFCVVSFSRFYFSFVVMLS